MKTKTYIVAFAVVALVAVSAVSFAGPANSPGRGAGRGGCGAFGFGPGVELTEEQQAALRAAYEEHAKKAAAIGQDLYAKNLELEAELAKAAPDAKRAASLTKEVNDLRGSIFAEGVAFRLKLAKDFGIRGGMMGGRGMMMGGGMMGQGFGPGDCPAWADDADDKANPNQ